MLEKSIFEIHNALVNKEITALDLTKEAILLAKNDKNNAFEYIMEKEAIEYASKLGEVDENNPLWGIPFVVKDNLSIKGVPATGSSNILNGYIPLYTATVVQKLIDSKCVPIGKTTLDEMAMGGTGTSSHIGMTYNPYDKSHTRLVGGSSAGSCACVAAGIVPFSLGSDTGDSIRKPASYAGLVGYKPTWSRISRFGLFSFVPSLDTVGFFTRNVNDVAYLLNVTAGHDDNDLTSSNNTVIDYVSYVKHSDKKYKIAVIKKIYESVKDNSVKEAFDKTLEKLKYAGFAVDFVDIDYDILRSLFPTYFILSCSEATSNNACMDGIKYGPSFGGATYEEFMKNARTKGFGEMIKRRFVLGSYSLMKENQFELFSRAQKCRRAIVNATNEILKNYDFIYLPAAPSIAPKAGDKLDPFSDEGLILDNHMCIGNFGGYPSITLPIGEKDGMPFGANFTGRPFEDGDVLAIANKLEEMLPYKNMVAKKD